MEKFAELIEKGAQQLGMTAQYLWPKAVLYTWAHAWAIVFGWMVFLGLMLFLTIRVRRAVWQHYKDMAYDREEARSMYIGVSTAVWVALSAAFLIVMTATVPVLTSPEWATVRDLLSVAK